MRKHHTEQINEIINDILHTSEEYEMVCEMANVARNFEINWSIYVEPDRRRNRPTYFKLYSDANYVDAEYCARISLLKPEYIIHKDGDKKPFVLNSHEKKTLINFLNGHQYGRKKSNVSELTVWQRLIAFWNKEMGYVDDIEDALDHNSENTDINDIDSPLPIDLEMPDYTKL